MTFDTDSLSPVEALLSPVRHSTHPWLTWYSQNGERVELSGRVFDNWVAKSANLLSEEFDLAPGDTVATDMPGHWKSAALALACWHLGAELRCVAPGTDPGTVDLFVTAYPRNAQRGRFGRGVGCPASLAGHVLRRRASRGLHRLRRRGPRLRRLLLRLAHRHQRGRAGPGDGATAGKASASCSPPPARREPRLPPPLGRLNASCRRSSACGPTAPRWCSSRKASRSPTACFPGNAW